MMQETDVAVIGVMLVDLPLGPLKDNLFAEETTMVEKISLTTGGDALNEAIILSRLGNRVSLIGHIGKDMLGEMILKRCEEERIDHSSVNADSKVSTRINVVLIKEDGQRYFIKNQGEGSRSLREEEINFELIQRARAVSLASLYCSKLRNFTLIEKILKTAKNNGVLTFADMVPMQQKDSIHEVEAVLPYLDYFLPNLEEARQLTGEYHPDQICDCLLRYGVKNIVIKMGKEGCFLKNSEIKMQIPAYYAKTIDTTGAGDNFAAGFITAVLEAKTLEESCRFANAVAAVSTESVGAAAGVVSKEQIAEYQNQNRTNYV